MPGQRPFSTQHSSRSGDRPDCKRPTGKLCSFFHARQPKSLPITDLRENGFEVESISIVLYGQYYGVVPLYEGKIDILCVAVFGNIVKGFLSDPKYHDPQGLGDILLFNTDLHLDVDFGIGGPILPEKPSKSRNDSHIVDNGGGGVRS